MLLVLRHVMLPLREIDASLPKEGLIYEIGSGHGAISDYLCKTPARNLVGLDLNNTKVAAANAHYQSANVKFVTADATTYAYQPAVGVVLSDFLHHIDYQTQEKILNQIPQYLQPQGVLVVKEINKDDTILMWLSRFWDFLLYGRDPIYYRRKQELVQMLQKLGFAVSVHRAVWWFPGSTFLYVCKKI